MSFATYFEWEIRQGWEAAFTAAWEVATRVLLTRDSHGSALFRTDAGNFAALARWPDRATRDAAFAEATFPSEAMSMGREIVRTIHRIDLEGIFDLWICTPS